MALNRRIYVGLLYGIHPTRDGADSGRWRPLFGALAAVLRYDFSALEMEAMANTFFGLLAAGCCDDY